MPDVSAMKQMRASYESYIQLPTLLACQKPISSREDALTWEAERFFIVCHQVSELWLSQILLDINLATRLVAAPTDWHEVRTVLTRAASMTVLLCRLLEQLVSSCPRTSFMKFRPSLQGLSACESSQFRELLHIISGAHPGVRRLEVALADSGTTPSASLRNDCSTVHQAGALKSMNAFIEGVVLWRKLHIFVARSFLGSMPGTGYTSGVDYLVERANSDARNSEASEHAEALALMLGNLESHMRDVIAELRQFDAVEGNFA